MVADFQPFMLTPLVIGMPQPMAEALGWPDTPIGWADVLELARSGGGWGDFGHPEWGPFRLGKTNPNFSTSGLSALIAQTYAATGTTTDLSMEDLADPDVVAFNEGVESAVVHYGDITQTFLNNLYRADQRGAGLTYVSAVAVEEKSIVDYNTGNPDGVLDPGEEPRPPRVPLVAIYPEEGTLFSDNPYIVLDAPWVDDLEREGAERFGEFVQQPDNQRKVLQFGFRPGNPEVAIGEPITAGNGLDPDQPQTTLEVPDPPVMIGVLDRWEEQRKKARVLLLIDISGSMGDPASPDDPGGPTKLDLAKQAAADALELFNEEDVIGLRVFSTNLGDDQAQEFLDLVAFGPAGEQRETVQTRIRSLFPTNATPLYTAIQSSYQTALEGFDPDRINAVVVLSDGKNDDGTTGDDTEQLEALLETLRAGSEGQASRPVRVFPIAYGTDADQTVLRRIAEASNSAVYTATDATTIGRVLTAVISNF
jgi:Ca-activated chloride channel homolog